MALLNDKILLELEEKKRMDGLKKKMRNMDCVKFSVNIPRSIHDKLRRKSLETGKDIKDLLLESIQIHLGIS